MTSLPSYNPTNAPGANCNLGIVLLATPISNHALNFTLLTRFMAGFLQLRAGLLAHRLRSNRFYAGNYRPCMDQQPNGRAALAHL